MSAAPSRLVLSKEQSEHLRAEGIRFAVIHPGSYPENVGRFVLDIIECDRAAVIDAIAVARGEKRAVKINATKS